MSLLDDRLGAIFVLPASGRAEAVERLSRTLDPIDLQFQQAILVEALSSSIDELERHIASLRPQDYSIGDLDRVLDELQKLSESVEQNLRTIGG